MNQYPYYQNMQMSNGNFYPGQMQSTWQQYTQQNQMQQMPPQQTIMQTVPDEMTARNAQIALDGSTAFYINTNGKEIYTKQISMSDGSLIFKKYVIEEPNKTQLKEYATLEDLEKLKIELYKMLGGEENK